MTSLISLPVLLPILGLPESRSITLEWPDSLGLAKDSSHSITLHHTQSHHPFLDSVSDYRDSSPGLRATAVGTMRNLLK